MDTTIRLAAAELFALHRVSSWKLKSLDGGTTPDWSRFEDPEAPQYAYRQIPEGFILAKRVKTAGHFGEGGEEIYFYFCPTLPRRLQYGRLEGAYTLGATSLKRAIARSKESSSTP